jgi:hypothetical protein
MLPQFPARAKEAAMSLKVGPLLGSEADPRFELTPNVPQMEAPVLTEACNFVEKSCNLAEMIFVSPPRGGGNT